LLEVKVSTHNFSYEIVAFVSLVPRIVFSFFVELYLKAEIERNCISASTFMPEMVPNLQFRAGLDTAFFKYKLIPKICQFSKVVRRREITKMNFF
jgi:hypothetical protein